VVRVDLPNRNRIGPFHCGYGDEPSTAEDSGAQCQTVLANVAQKQDALSLFPVKDTSGLSASQVGFVLPALGVIRSMDAHSARIRTRRGLADSAFKDRMSQIYVPTKSIEDWKPLLAQPDRHWQPGFSAMTLARAWEASPAGRFPTEVEAILKSSGRAGWDNLKLLAAIPEYKVPLRGGSRASQTDLLALARGPDGLIVVAVEGKVDEPLGPTYGQRSGEAQTEPSERLDFLIKKLELSQCPDDVRYQLLHRTASALIVAEDFAAESAVMLIHSFSPTHKWLDDFKKFGNAMGQQVDKGQLVSLGKRSGTPLYIGWCVGDQRFRTDPAAGIT